LMELEEALKIIGMVSDGLNPYKDNEPTEQLPEINPITMRAVCTAIISLLRAKDKDEIALHYEVKRPTEFTESVSGPLRIHLKNEEANEIRKALLDANFNESEAANRLNISLSDLRSKESEYGISSLTYAYNYFESENPNGIDLDSYIEKIESRIIFAALKVAGSNKSNAAELLGITFRSLRYRLEKLIEIDAPTSEYDYFKTLGLNSIDEFLDNIEKEIIFLALEKSGNNKIQASNLLGISYRSFRYKFERHNLADKDF
jgi:transcriptional regulator with PAS, ATPase and Fis domain